MWVSVAVTIVAAAMIGLRHTRPRVSTHGQQSAHGLFGASWRQHDVGDSVSTVALGGSRDIRSE
jgi:hypothetical protein